MRELGNVIERMVIFQKRGQLDKAGLPTAVVYASARARRPAAGDGADDGLGLAAARPQACDLRAVVAQLEESLIDQALERTGGNRNAAAQLLGLNRTTLVEKLKRAKKPTET